MSLFANSVAGFFFRHQLKPEPSRRLTTGPLPRTTTNFASFRLRRAPPRHDYFRIPLLVLANNKIMVEKAMTGENPSVTLIGIRVGKVTTNTG
ncbi:hypothetical protein Bca52824_049003 [Brassica carinata]|uniref:Uncharacterized protein n=1 Tax=Brassica carinata TaxID=52824 RepID=A0A8X7RHU0_BRACI|nr:hypothetical protein Bca52824_049003 [Brassica carinata]